MLSLAQAAKQVGKSKPTVQRAIKAGKLSAVRRDDGSYEIDPAELARVFPLAGDIPAQMKRYEPLNGGGTSPVILSEAEGLRALLAEREARIADKDAVIEDLRRRLDQATALLTDQRSAPMAEPRTLWGRFLAWRK